MLMGLFIVLLLLLILLVIPVSLIFHVSKPRDAKGDLEVVWLFGLLRVPVFFSRFSKPGDKNGNRKKPGQKKPDQSKHSQKKHDKKPTNRNKSRKSGSRIKWITKPAVVRRILRFVRDLWRAIRRESILVNLRIGLGDPADTGELWGIIGPVSAVINNSPDVAISVEPEFFEATLDVQGSGKIWFYPLQLVFLISGLLLSLLISRAYPLTDQREHA